MRILWLYMYKNLAELRLAMSSASAGWCVKFNKTRQAGHDVVVVVSAMGHETDRLISLIHSVTANPEPREYDALTATGEQVSAAMVKFGAQFCRLSAPALIMAPRRGF